MIERLGDLIACSIIAKELKKRDPTLAIAWVCSIRYTDVFEGNPHIDAVFNEESLSCWLLSRRHLGLGIRPVELFLDTQRCCWTGVRLPGRNSGVTHYNYLHRETNLLLSYAKAAGLQDIPNVEPELFIETTDIEQTPSCENKPTMALHFDSDDAERRINPDAARHFAQLALAKGWNLVELGLRPIVSSTEHEVIFPGPACGLRHQLGILESVQHFVGVDSAFLHAANAFRIPSTLILGKFRHFDEFQTFSGSFFHSSCCTIVRGPVPAADISPQILGQLVPALPSDTLDKP